MKLSKYTLYVCVPYLISRERERERGRRISVFSWFLLANVSWKKVLVLIEFVTCLINHS